MALDESLHTTTKTLTGNILQVRHTKKICQIIKKHNKTMNKQDEEKARELAGFQESVNPIPTQRFVFDKCVEMAAWKQEQALKAFCKVTCKGYKDTGGKCFCDGRCDMYKNFKKAMEE